MNYSTISAIIGMVMNCQMLIQNIKMKVTKKTAGISRS